MKNFDGIFPLPATCEELGKKAPVGPSPSPSMLSGAIDGFLIAYCLLHDSRRYHEAALIIAAISRTPARVTMLERALLFCPIQTATRIETAMAAVMMCSR